MDPYSAEEYFYKLDNMILSSNQVLRKHFQARWKQETGKTWQHTEEQGTQFVDGIGKTAHKKASKQQKNLISSGCLDEWDMTILSLVLQNFGNVEAYQAENEAVKTLNKIRNELAHHPARKLSREQFNEKVESFQIALRALQVNEEVIKKIIEKAGTSSSEAALKATNKLCGEADEFLQTEDFEKAIICLDEATTMPSLLQVNQGIAYEKRAECYLQLAHYKKRNQNRTEADKCIEQAFMDATEALELSDSSWRAHHILGRCHRWQNHFDEAIVHYQTALAISPVQKQVKIDLDVCKSLESWRKREEITDPRNLPLTLTEALDHLESETGIRLTEEQFIFLKKDVEGSFFKGQQHVFLGHQYRMGWSVPQNDKEAVLCFEKAAEVGNAEGIYYLGFCYRHGRGIEQDLVKAFELFLKAAKMSPDLPGMPTFVKKNVGVVSAQHCVGIFYEYGYVVEQDYSEAIMWYQKATDNGNGTSAYNLGKMYAHSMGVPKNLKTAEMYWNQAIILEEPKAAENLVFYYLHHLEPERARAMFQTGRQLESVVLNGISEEEFEDMIQPKLLRRKMYEADVLEYENQNKLDIKGMTFLERLNRFSFTKDPATSKLLKEFAELGTNSKKSWGGQIKPCSDSDFEQLLRLTHQGSVTADMVVKTMLTSFKICHFLALAQANAVLSTSRGISNSSRSTTSQAPKQKRSSILEQKPYLSSPVRKRLILEHRHNMFQLNEHKKFLTFPMTKPPKLTQTAPSNMGQSQPITLKEMNPTIDTIYEDRVVDLTIVEDPCYDFNPYTVYLVVEDENGDLARFYLYNVPHDEETKKKLSFGCTLAVLNPYMRIEGVDGTNGIRNDEPRCVIYLGKVNFMCRFCGEENAPHACSKCKRASYCDRECQKKDWKSMKHKLICRP